MPQREHQPSLLSGPFELPVNVYETSGQYLRKGKASEDLDDRIVQNDQPRLISTPPRGMIIITRTPNTPL